MKAILPLYVEQSLDLAGFRQAERRRQDEKNSEQVQPRVHKVISVVNSQGKKVESTVTVDSASGTRAVLVVREAVTPFDLSLQNAVNQQNLSNRSLAVVA